MKPRPKLDWERVQMENLIAERGAETIRDEKEPEKRIVMVKCRFCKTPLRDNSPKADAKHAATCKRFRKVWSEKKIRASKGRPPIFGKPITNWLDKKGFPFCLVGVCLRTPNFAGTVTNISHDGSTLEVSDGSEYKRFMIQVLIDIEKKCGSGPAVPTKSP
jgi:hypothetical protein